MTGITVFNAQNCGIHQSGITVLCFRNDGSESSGILKAEVVIATNVPPVCAGARVNAIIKHFPEIIPSNILIGARKDLLVADMMLDDTSQNLEQANVDYPVLYRQP